MDGRPEEKSSVSSALLAAVVILMVLACGGIILSNAALPSVDDNSFPLVKANFDLEKSKALVEARLLEQIQKRNQTFTTYQEKLKLLQKSFEARSDAAITTESSSSDNKPSGSIVRLTGPPTPSENELLQKLLMQARPECDCAATPLADTDFFGGDLKTTRATTQEDCCQDCLRHKGCTRWTFGESCYLKTDDAKEVRKANLYSGVLPSACRPTPRPTNPPAPTPPTPPPTWPRVVVDGPKLCGALSGQPGWTCETTAVLVLTFNRAEYLSQTLDSLFAAHPDPEVRQGQGRGSLFPIIVSQDGADRAVGELLKQHSARLHHIKQRHFEEKDVLDMAAKQGGARPKRWMYPYFALSVHYKKALSAVFSRGFRHVIVLEEDLPVAPDFFEYFLATGPLLAADPSLYCVSAWNDNGQAIHGNDPTALHRTDMFPGLGWMMGVSLWEELKDSWPQQYWDDFLRHPKWRKERQCIRPEMSRTMHIGKKGGASKTLLKGKVGKSVFAVELTSKSVSFSQYDLSFLLQDAYEARFVALVRIAKLIHVDEIEQHASHAPILLAVNQQEYANLTGTKGLYPVKVRYDSLRHFAEIATKYGLMADEKAGVPRTAYKGVVQFRFVADNELVVFLFPKEDFYQHCGAETCSDGFFKPIPASIDLAPIA